VLPWWAVSPRETERASRLLLHGKHSRSRRRVCRVFVEAVSSLVSHARVGGMWKPSRSEAVAARPEASRQRPMPQDPASEQSRISSVSLGISLRIDPRLPRTCRQPPRYQRLRAERDPQWQSYKGSMEHRPPTTHASEDVDLDRFVRDPESTPLGTHTAERELDRSRHSRIPAHLETCRLVIAAGAAHAPVPSRARSTDGSSSTRRRARMRRIRSRSAAPMKSPLSGLHAKPVMPCYGVVSELRLASLKPALAFSRRDGGVDRAIAAVEKTVLHAPPATASVCSHRRAPVLRGAVELPAELAATYVHATPRQEREPTPRARVRHIRKSSCVLRQRPRCQRLRAPRGPPETQARVQPKGVKLSTLKESRRIG